LVRSGAGWLITGSVCCSLIDFLSLDVGENFGDGGFTWMEDVVERNDEGEDGGEDILFILVEKGYGR
jgi:hypothetical protein